MRFHHPVASRRLPRLFDVAPDIREILQAGPRELAAARAVAWLRATHREFTAADALAYVRCVLMGGPWPYDLMADEVPF